MTNRPALGLLLAFSGSVLSCAKTPDQLPVYSVKGRVLYEGRPAAGAVVVLHSTDEAVKACRPHGRADANGDFELTTYRTGDGAPAAAYVVTVQWKRSEDHPEQGADLLPPGYGDPSTSKLTVTVIPGPNEPLVLQLTARS
jgi:hypothetical protein